MEVRRIQKKGEEEKVEEKKVRWEDRTRWRNMRGKLEC